MLFNVGKNIFESYKERNLYYKFFAGYYFNDLIPGWEQRVKDFWTLLKEKNACSEKPRELAGELSTQNIHVSFDNHGCQIKDWQGDRGEFADVFIKRLLITSELSDESSPPTIIQCLLVTKQHLYKAQAAEPTLTATLEATPTPAQAKIEINSATLDKLTELPGIGKKIAQRIIDGRPYAKIEDLLEVKGIGKKKLAKIKDLIECKPLKEGKEAEGKEVEGEKTEKEPEAEKPKDEKKKEETKK